MPNIVITADANLTTPLAVQLRIAEVKAERARARLTCSDFAARRLPSLAAPWRGKVAWMGRRIKALEERLADMTA